MLDKMAKMKALQDLISAMDEDELGEMKGTDGMGSEDGSEAMMKMHEMQGETGPEGDMKGVETEQEIGGPEGAHTSLEFENITPEERQKLLELYSQIKG